MTALSKNDKIQKASDYVNLETYDRPSRLIISKPTGDKTFIGRTYKASSLIGEAGEFFLVLNQLIKNLPDDSVTQVSLLCSPDHDAVKTFKIGKEDGGPVVQELIQRQANIFRSALKVGWQDDTPILNVREVIISVAIPVNNASQKIVDENLTLQQDFFVKLKGCGFADIHTLTIEELASTYRKFVDIFEPYQDVKIDEIIEIRKQMFQSDTVLDFRDKTIGNISDHTFVTGITCKAFPEESSRGLMNTVSGAPFNTGKTQEGGGHRISTPFILTTTIRVANQRKEWGRVDNAIKSRTAQQRFPFKLGSEDPTEKLADLQVLKKQCSGEASKFVYASMTIFFFGRTKHDVVQAASAMKGTLEKLDFNPVDIVHSGLVRFAQTLPMNFSPKVADGLAGEAIMSSAAATTLLPVYGDYLGNVTSTSPFVGQGYITRRGCAHFFDPYVSDKGYGGTIAADTGSGKSFLVQYKILCHLAEGSFVFHLDNGRSAKKFCKAVGGEFNEFGASGFKPSLNPFTGLSGDEFDEQQETITSLLLLMAYEGETPEAGARIALNEAVKAAYGQRQSDAEISTVIEALMQIRDGHLESSVKSQVVQAASNLIPRLKAFIESPTRGQYFRGKGTLDPKKQFTVFELGALGDDEHLKKCVLFFVLNLLMTKIKTIRGRKIIIVDEAHDLLKDQAATSVMEGIYLKGRKDKVSIWVIVQSLLKLASMPSGAVILKQSTWKMILSQAAEEIDSLVDQKVLTTFAEDPYFNRLLKSIETRKGKFSEILIIGPKSYEAVRLYVDRFTSTLFSSEGDARDVIFDLMDQGVDPIEAVNKILNDAKDRRSGWIRQFLNQLIVHDGLTPSEIIKEIKEAI